MVENTARFLLLVVFSGLAVAQINLNTNIPKRKREIPKTIVVFDFVYYGYRKNKRTRFFCCQRFSYEFINSNNHL